MLFELKIVRHYLRLLSADSFLNAIAILSVAISVAILLIIMSLTNGFHTKLLQHIIAKQGHISVTPIYQHIQNVHEKMSLLQEQQEIKHVIPVIEEHALVYNTNNIQKGATLLKGFLHEDIDLDLSDDCLKCMTQNGVIISNNIANILDIEQGDTISLLTINMIDDLSFNDNNTFKVCSITNDKLYAGSIVMNLLTLQQLLEYDNNSVDRIDIFLYDEQDTFSVACKILSLLQENNEVWYERSGIFLDAIKTEKSVMFLILVLVVIISMFSITSSLMVMVREKKYDIAIYTTVGASGFMIFRIFLIIGMCVSLLGIITGLSIGLLFLHNMDSIKNCLLYLSNYAEIFYAIHNFLLYIPVEIFYKDVINIFYMAFCISILATIIPAIIATHQKPARILRNQ
ncbi:MAG: putative permease family protein [Candidatus Xenolissoclinum pacificiensis L6]|uniref:Permease family protein n=1 Tax=Candidatus Xenolissoclinum pacificiensis L6 TaxID=1401685 RepID=W2V2S6_9RICK|nr:MAG: putative permease family protein [Candidatus Xenolissoclinum pacificiensis L6]